MPVTHEISSNNTSLYLWKRVLRMLRRRRRFRNMNFELCALSVELDTIPLEKVSLSEQAESEMIQAISEPCVCRELGDMEVDLNVREICLALTTNTCRKGLRSFQCVNAEQPSKRQRKGTIVRPGINNRETAQGPAVMRQHRHQHWTRRRRCGVRPR